MIALSGVSKHFGRRALFVDASFQLDPGDKVGLVGPNGSGKSTLFRLIVGEDTPDAGEVSVPKNRTLPVYELEVLHREVLHGLQVPRTEVVPCTAEAACSTSQTSIVSLGPNALTSVSKYGTISFW